ncbi:acetyl-CoA hydrolase/transferase family protein [Variovorax sp. M-6]|uniref:acetyl-CoA hydrolase/transferase family protein n=1 Tax=Variovorax sp. M-6 TaxID=3233041 RepID=UPI003F96B224
MTRGAPVRSARDFDFRGLLRAGDRIVCGQVTAEPRTLTRKLLQQADDAMPLTMFLGATMSDTFAGRLPSAMRFVSYGALAGTASLADRGLLDVVAEPYSALAGLFESGAQGADVVLLQLAPGRDGRPPSLGLANDYTLAAARRARVVIAELNPAAPWTHGAELPDALRIDHWVEADCAPLEAGGPAAGPVGQAIAAHLAGLIPEGATLQAGIGSLPDAALAQLGRHRHLGIHSGVLGDAAAKLVEEGAVTNERKGLDAGITVTNTVVGSASLYRWVDSNRTVEVRPASYTHAASVLSRLDRLCAINSALEVDLSGQANCEAVDGRQRGGIGGLIDFCRAARHSTRGGRSIVVLPATAGGGTRSRIVFSLEGNPATIGRADADVVVTEFGVAELRNATLDQRAQRLIAVAAPAFRDPLAQAWRQSTWGRRTWH